MTIKLTLKLTDLHPCGTFPLITKPDPSDNIIIVLLSLSLPYARPPIGFNPESEDHSGCHRYLNSRGAPLLRSSQKFYAVKKKVVFLIFKIPSSHYCLFMGTQTHIYTSGLSPWKYMSSYRVQEDQGFSSQTEGRIGHK